MVGRGRAADLSAQFDDIVRTYEAPISRYLYGMVGDVELARDLAQETFISACQALSQSDFEITNLSGWLYRIATNHALSHFRRRKLIRWVPLDKLLGTSHDPRSDDHGERAAINHSVETTLARLDPKERACLLLKAAGFSSQEIGEQLGCSQAAARTRLFRARESFRRMYHQHDLKGMEGP